MSDTALDTPPAVRSRIRWRAVLERFGPLVALLVLFTVSALCSPYNKGNNVFLKAENLENVLLQASFIGIVSIGMTFVIILGGIDLSVGSMVALAGGVGVWAMNTLINARAIDPAVDGAIPAALASLCKALHIAGSENWGIALAAIAIMLVATMSGLLNGVAISVGRIAPFIATLATMAIFRSLVVALADGGQIASASPTKFQTLGVGGIAVGNVLLRYPILAFIAVAIIGQIILGMTRYGRYVYAIGNNERAAVYSAVNVKRIKLLTYVLIGVTCGVAGLLNASYFNSVSSGQAGSLWELDAIAAVVIGGTRMQGGAGNIFGTVVGVLTLVLIGNLMSLQGVSSHLQGMVKGLVILAAAFIQQTGRRSD